MADGRVIASIECGKGFAYKQSAYTSDVIDHSFVVIHGSCVSSDE
jgi:hypothetical protein